MYSKWLVWAISWKSIKKSINVSSTMQVEFVACYYTNIEAVWLKKFVLRVHVIDSIFNPIKIHCGVSLVVFYSKNNR